MSDGGKDERGGLEAALANGRALLASDPAAAAEQAAEILRVRPRVRDALRLLAAALRRLGRPAEAERAEIEATRLFAQEADLAEAASYLTAGRLADAERRLRPYLRQRPDDVAAMLLLAEALLEGGIHDEAEALFRQSLQLVPSFVDARLGFATLLFRRGDAAASLEELEAILRDEPQNVGAALDKATTLGHIGEYQRAAAVYEALLRRDASQPIVWLSYGNVLKTLGRSEEAVAAYRRVLALQPSNGEAWWSLTNMKSVRLTAEDRAAMDALLQHSGLAREDRLHLDFALGQLFEDEGEYEAAFHRYAEGNRLRRETLPYDAAFTSDEVRRSKALFTPAFFAGRVGQGCPAPDPIFILGMPRAGSTLIEQILASHSAVEGTSELPYIPALARGLVAESGSDARYPEVLAEVDGARLRALGQAYLDRVGIHRKTRRPRFIDKLPNNWADLGLILLILPNAKIVDARREPMDCCFSNFKQHYAVGQPFSYALDDMGLYYRDYVDLMAHFDAVLPGRVHRVVHEDLVERPDEEVRRLLEYLDLPFEEACLTFYENRRPVRTASAEQVRRPINRAGIGRWRPFEPWLGPLKEALGPALAGWRSGAPPPPQ
jgi:tetratricopeptide (TPR) repeat protein